MGKISSGAALCLAISAVLFLEFETVIRSGNQNWCFITTIVDLTSSEKLRNGYTTESGLRSQVGHEPTAAPHVAHIRRRVYTGVYKTHQYGQAAIGCY